MKKKVTFVMSVAGTGDPSPASLKRKYESRLRELTANSAAATAAGRLGKSAEEIDAIVESEKRRDARIPRVSGFEHEFSFKPKDIALIDAALAQKWQDAGICIIDEDSTSKKAA